MCHVHNYLLEILIVTQAISLDTSGSFRRIRFDNEIYTICAYIRGDFIMNFCGRWIGIGFRIPLLHHTLLHKVIHSSDSIYGSVYGLATL